MQGEGPSVFKPTATDYYLIASHLTYWNPNPPMLFHASASSLRTAAWHSLTVPARGEGANTTFNSQSGFVFPLTFADGTVLYIYMGDRWNFAGPGSVCSLLNICIRRQKHGNIVGPSRLVVDRGKCPQP